MSGRFAPSPTGELHLGNLRTALLAWLLARSENLPFLVRMEDLDRANASADHERCQLDDLAALGIDHDGEVLRQSDRFDIYGDVLADLDTAGLVYPCWCTRREIAAEIESSASAPHGPAAAADPATIDPAKIEVPVRAYPGTCRELSSAQRGEREATGRPPALRLRAFDAVVEVHDRIWGTRRGLVDDVVLRRGDGVPAYNLAVVVDDHLQGVSQVVRGDDLLSSTPRHVYLQRLLGFAVPDYVHVPLVLGDDGERLAKRHGAVTRRDLEQRGVDASRLLTALARSLGVELTDEHALEVGTADDLLGGTSFELDHVPTRPVALHELMDLTRSQT